MTGRRARVFGPLILTTVSQLSDAAPWLDAANVRDAEGRRYGGLVFGRGPRALVVGWRDAAVPSPARWRPRFLLAALRLAILALVNRLLVRVGLAVIVLPPFRLSAEAARRYEAALRAGAVHVNRQGVHFADQGESPVAAAERAAAGVLRDLGHYRGRA